MSGHFVDSSPYVRKVILTEVTKKFKLVWRKSLNHLAWGSPFVSGASTELNSETRRAILPYYVAH